MYGHECRPCSLTKILHGFVAIGNGQILESSNCHKMFKSGKSKFFGGCLAN